MAIRYSIGDPKDVADVAVFLASDAGCRVLADKAAAARPRNSLIFRHSPYSDSISSD